MKKRALSVFLALCMLLALAPAVFADTQEEQVVDCSSISAVVRAIEAAGTTPTVIRLNASGSCTDMMRSSPITISEGQTITIDLNGNNWQGIMIACSPYILNQGTLTLLDSTNNRKQLNGVFNNRAGVVIENRGTLQIAARIGAIAGTGNDPFPATGVVSSGELTISEGANINGSMECAVQITGGTAQITGGGILCSQGGDGLHVDGGSVSISGGKMEGTQSGLAIKAAASATVTITGGTFSSDVSDYLGEYCEQDENGTVTQTIPVTGITISGETAVKVGETITLHATVIPENATEGSVTWSSSDGSIATVDDSGVVTGVAAGEATITAAAGGASVSCTITVAADRPTLPGLIPGLLDAGHTMVDTYFVDVRPMDYYFDAVNWAYEHGITGGTGKLTFAPDAPCTRAQAVTFLWRAMGSPAAKTEASFTDVKPDAYYAAAVNWAVENGITNGTSADKFSPDAPCTRAQIVTLLYRAIGAGSMSDAGFTDVPATAYYADAVNWATQHKVTDGTGESRFSPDATCTRAQIVTFLYRAG